PPRLMPMQPILDRPETASFRLDDLFLCLPPGTPVYPAVAAAAGRGTKNADVPPDPEENDLAEDDLEEEDFDEDDEEYEDEEDDEEEEYDEDEEEYDEEDEDEDEDDDEDDDDEDDTGR